MKNIISSERLRALFNYDPETGHFTCRVKRRGQQVGDIANCAFAYGYRRLHIDGREYPEHRLAFLYMTGAFPVAGMEVDHINHMRDDNRWANLRQVTHAENMRNVCRDKSQYINREKFSSKYHGVHWCVSLQRWRTYVYDHKLRRRRYVGQFLSEEEAYAAYLAARGGISGHAVQVANNRVP